MTLFMLSPLKSHRIKTENIASACWLSWEVEVPHHEVKVSLALLCESFFFFISVYFITDRKAVWGASREGGKEHQQWSFLPPLLPFLLPCGSWEICARPGVGVAIILLFLCFSPLVWWCWLESWATRMLAVASPSWPHTPLVKGLCVPCLCCALVGGSVVNGPRWCLTSYTSKPRHLGHMT